MAKGNTTLFAVLGVLSKGDCSGYDIRKHFNESVSHFWSESYGQIYPALRKLVEQGYIEEIRSTGARGQKKYRITPEGTEYFHAWLAEPVGSVNYRDELLLKVFFGKERDAGALKGLFEHELEKLEQSRHAYRQQQEILQHYEKQEQHPFLEMTLRYGVLSIEARYEWCREAISMLTKLQNKEV